MGSTPNIILRSSSHTAMTMQGQEKEIKVTVRYNVKETKKTWTAQFVDGGAIGFVVHERVISSSQMDFSPCICNLLSPEGSERFVLRTLSLINYCVPGVSIRDLTTPIAQHSYYAAWNAVGRGCNTLFLTFTVEIKEAQLLLDRGELENLNEQIGFSVVRAIVPATDDEIAALKTRVFKKLENKYFDCNICLEDFAEDAQVKQMPCLHIFHGPCIVQWLKRSNSCPICRYRLQHVS